MSQEIEILEGKANVFFDPSLLSYNPNYFSATLCLPEQGERTPYSIFQESGRWVVSRDPARFQWARLSVSFLLEHEKRPWIIVNGATDILAKIKLSGSKLALLRSEPLAIFLFEPLFPHKDGMNWRPTSPDQVDFSSAELDSILALNEHHGGQLNITVYTCDHGLERLTAMHPKYSSIKIKTFDIFLIEYLLGSNLSTHPPFCSQIAKTAICLNFRYDLFREIMVAFLRERNYHLRSFISFYHHHHPEAFSELPFPMEDWPFGEIIHRGIEKMQPELPYSLNTERGLAVCALRQPLPDRLPGANRRRENFSQQFYENAFVSIVNETRFFSFFPNISEKTLNSFLYYRPVLLAAPPGSLRYLRELGFRTFGQFWDEGYDEELSHPRRLERLFSLIDEIFSYSHRQMEELLWEMQPVLYHNRIQLSEFPGQQGAALRAESR